MKFQFSGKYKESNNLKMTQLSIKSKDRGTNALILDAFQNLDYDITKQYEFKDKLYSLLKTALNDFRVQNMKPSLFCVGDIKEEFFDNLLNDDTDLGKYIYSKIFSDGKYEALKTCWNEEVFIEAMNSRVLSDNELYSHIASPEKAIGKNLEISVIFQKPNRSENDIQKLNRFFLEEIYPHQIAFDTTKRFSREYSNTHIILGMVNMHNVLLAKSKYIGAPQDQEEREILYDKLSKGFTFFANSFEEKYKQKRLTSSEIFSIVEAFGDAGHACTGRWQELLEKLTVQLELSDKKSLGIDPDATESKIHPLTEVFSNARDIEIEKLAKSFFDEFYRQKGIGYEPHYKGYFKRYLNKKYDLRVTTILNDDNLLLNTKKIDKNIITFLEDKDLDDLIIRRAKIIMSKTDLSKNTNLYNSIYEWAKSDYYRNSKSTFEELPDDIKKSYQSYKDFIDKTAAEYVSENVFDIDDSSYVINGVKIDILDKYLHDLEFTIEKRLLSQKDLTKLLKTKIAASEVSEAIEIIKTGSLSEKALNNMLIHAIRCNQLSIARELVNAGADVNCRLDTLNIFTTKFKVLLNKKVDGSKSITPLILACKYNSSEIVDYLIESGANVNGANSANQVPLHIAAAYRNLEIINSLISAGAIVDKKNFQRQTPLMVATTFGNIEVIEKLYSCGASVNSKSIKGYTPLMMAIQFSPVAVKCILDKNPNIFATDYIGNNALDYATKFNSHNATKLILDHMAPLGKQSVSNFFMRPSSADYPLFNAIKNNNAQIVSELLKNNGKKISIAHTHISRGMYNAIFCNQTSIIRAIKTEVPSFDLNLPIQDNLPPIKLAICTGSLEALSTLLDLGAKISNDHLSPIIFLIEQAKLYPQFRNKNNQQELLNTLIVHGASLDATTKNGDTPLMLALKFGNDDLAKILVRVGADLSIKNSKGMTALDYAAELRNPMHYNLILRKLKLQERKTNPKSQIIKKVIYEDTLSSNTASKNKSDNNTIQNTNAQSNYSDITRKLDDYSNLAGKSKDTKTANESDKQESSFGGSFNSHQMLETVTQRTAGIPHFEEVVVLTARESDKNIFDVKFIVEKNDIRKHFYLYELISSNILNEVTSNLKIEMYYRDDANTSSKPYSVLSNTHAKLFLQRLISLEERSNNHKQKLEGLTSGKFHPSINSLEKTEEKIRDLIIDPNLALSLFITKKESQLRQNLEILTNDNVLSSKQKQALQDSIEKGISKLTIEPYR